MSSRRVVITGLGVIASCGSDKEAFWQGIRARKSAIRFTDRFDASRMVAQCAAQVDDYQPAMHFPPHKLKRLDRYGQFALLVTRQALEDAGIPPATENPTFRTGVSFGTALGGVTVAEAQHERFLRDGHIPAALALQVFGGSAHSNIAIAFGFRGYGTTNSNSCASGTVAVGEAYRVIRDGIADTMIAGAVECPLSPLTFGAFDTIRAMAKETEDPSAACRPFDRDRTGFVMGEGGAALILESLDHARARGARIYAEVLGYALNNDAYHMTSSLPGMASAIRVMQDTLDEAGVRPAEVSYINAHASATMLNDDGETEAILAVFGEKTPPISGTKPYYGHPLGASGAIEAMICCLALQDQWIPPTLNCPNPVTPPGLDLVREDGRPAPLRYILSNSFGFGGINSCLLLAAPPEG